MTSSTNRKCRWGFLSTAGIGKKNWQAIWNAGNGQVVAVASRDRKAAEVFIRSCQAEYPWEEPPIAIEGYDALLERPDIDAVYIPLPTKIRSEWVEKALSAGKHVLAEKPAAMNAQDVTRLLGLAKTKGLQYMDGVMFMHSRRLEALRNVLDDSMSVGAIRRIYSQFSFLGDSSFCSSNIRVHSELEPHGCLGDLGWYCIRMALWVMRGVMPTKVIGRRLESLQGESSPHSVPGTFSAELYFPNDVTAGFYCSFLNHHQQWTHISGDRGYVWVEDFVLPFFHSEVEFHVANSDFQINGCHFNMERHSRRIAQNEYGNNHPNSQEAKMMRTMGNFALTGRRDDQWERWTWQTQVVLDALWQSSLADGEVIEVDQG